MRSRIDRPVPDLRACRILAEVVVALPVRLRPDRARREAAAAVGADVPDYVIDAIGAERAFVGADARLERVGRQRLVAVFAGGAEFEHVQILTASGTRR